VESGNDEKAAPVEQEFHIKDRLVDNWESSDAARSLQRMQANDRVKYVVIITPQNACPACQQLAGTYPKDKVPSLPIEYCSEPNGCRSYYLPYLGDLYP
jgi:hypothetical protein